MRQAGVDRRQFLKGTAWMGAAAVAAGCMSRGAKLAAGGGAMQGFRVAPLKKIRVGQVGCGQRGKGALMRMAQIPGVEVAEICDLHPERTAYYNKLLTDAKYRPAREHVGPEAYRELCESDIDVVYITTGWDMHVPVALYAMEHGKHALIEVPAAVTLEDCWALVESAERTRRHCMQLENCCYGEIELLTKSLVEKGILGELVHAECGYIHDLRELCYADPRPEIATSWPRQGYDNFWRLRHNQAHKGNQYETHGLGPVCEYMNVNRGDRLDYLVSLESNQFNFEAYARANFPDHPWKGKLKIEMGDMNTTLIRTVRGRSIMVQHDVSSPRPYSRINLVTGTKGILKDYPFSIAFESKPGAGCHDWFDKAGIEEIRREYMHPLWKKAGLIAQKVGGHGGMDFLMDLRWAYCLQNGLPLDTDVYDLATWCSLGGLTEESVRSRSRSVDVPDFTHGGWKTAAPFGLFDIDLEKMGIRLDSVKKDGHAFSV